jgi:hypothetical protein
MENNDLERVGDAEQALVNEAPAGLRPTGFDPSREALIKSGLLAVHPAPNAAAPFCPTALVNMIISADGSVKPRGNSDVG